MIQTRERTRGKLTRPAVDAIKLSLNEGVEGTVLARLYEVSEATISRIKHGTRWNRNGGKPNLKAKLTIQQVMEIRQLLRNGETCSSLARQYSVTRPTISNIKHGKKWKYVQ